MSLLTSTNELNSTSSQFLLYNQGAMAGAPGPAGAQGPPGPQGVPGNDGANTFGTWLYNTNNPPAPEDLFLGPTTLILNYSAELPGGLVFLRAARNLFNSNGGTLTLSFQQEQGTFGPVSVSLLVSAITLDDILGLATLTFTYIGGAVPPFVWAVGQSVEVVVIGGAVGPTGPPGPPGTPGGNDWYNYPALGPVDMSGQSILGLDDIAMTGDISGATSITTSGNLTTVGVIASGPISSGSTITASGTVSGLDVSATNTVSGNTVSATTSISAPTGTLTVQNANITSTANIYTDLLAGFGTLQVGSPNPLAANPGLIYLNGSLYQSRGNCNANITANGIYIDGNTIIPGAVGFEVGSIPVAGVNTCRFSVNSLTSPASIVGIAPLGITFDAGAASNFSSVGPTTISTAADIILQAANNNAFIQGGALPGDFCDLTFTHGGSIQNLGGLNGQTTGLNISNINQLSGAAAGPGAGTISVANTLQGGASVNFQTAGDVVSSLGGAAYSLNTIGANYNIVGGFYKTANQSAPTGNTDITWDASYGWGDSLNCFSITPGGTAITCNVRGVYEIAAHLFNLTGTSTAAATNSRGLSFDLTRAPNPRINGFVNSNQLNLGSGNYNQITQGVVELLVGDILHVRLAQILTGGSSIIDATVGDDPNTWMTYSLRKRLP